MPSVENRIVRMEFDNAAFQANVKKTIDSLTQLDKALKLEGANKGIADVTAAASKLANSINFSGIHKGITDTAAAATGLDKAFKLDTAKQSLSDLTTAAHRVDLSPIQTSIQRVSAGFLTLSTVAVTALASITTAALHAATQLARPFSFGPIVDGFQEFQTNIGSIQTILSNTRADGTGLQEVNAALDQLNEFSDKTIFNFGEMTRNIGTFTAAGVDLETSVNSIKGIANLAAISGSTSEQAATAMFQLSQAIATGTVRLIDWNSVVNAGMGGETFQKALFETGKAMGKITDVPMDTTFEEWTDAGNSFRDSLQEGWLTSEVLTTTLRGFSGEMTKAELLSKGFTEQQADALLELGQVGLEAATKIRTLSQLLTTVKETIGSGWSQTFRTVIGDFEQSSELFTNINNIISGFVNKQADARNALLQGFVDLGGRDVAIRGIVDAFAALINIIRPIKEAFRDIFPPATAQTLFNITKSFADFTRSLAPSERTVANLKRIFTGFFSALDLGWEIIKAGVGFIKDLVVEVTGLGNGDILEFAADIGDFFTALRDGLDQGDRVKQFFQDLKDAIEKPVDKIKNLKEAIKDLFAGLGDFGQPFLNFLTSIGTTLREIGDKIAEFFDKFKQKLNEAFGGDALDEAGTGVTIGLLGGILFALKKFLDEGLSLDVTGGIIDKVSDALTELTGTLKAMQTNLKADALTKIAIAIGLLTASIVVLSLLDPAKLAAGLAAITTGFGQLIGSFVALNRLDLGIFSGAKILAVSTAMAILAGAILILSVSLALIAQLSWNEILKGLTAITVMLSVLSAAAIVISRNTGSLIAASIGMTAIAVSLTLLAGAVALFARFDWDEMFRGFGGVAIGLAVIAAGMRLMPQDLFLRGAGLLLIAGAMVILAKAVEAFSNMEWEEIGRGLAGMAGALIVIAGAMHLMPDLILTGAGLILVSIALNKIADAVKSFSELSWAEMARGLVAMAAALVIIGVAMNAMSSSIFGATSMLIMAAALTVLADVLKELSDIPFGDLAKGIAGMALALLVLVGLGALANSFGFGLLSLGAAMLFVGAGFALFGVGMEKVANAFKTLAENGKGAGKAIEEAMKAIGKALPELVVGFAQGLIDLIKVIGAAGPEVAKAMAKILSAVLIELAALLPEFGTFMLSLIETILRVIVEATPMIIDAGWNLFLSFLQGIRDHIGELVTVVSDIIIEFLNAMAEKGPEIVTAGTNLVLALMWGIASNLGKVTEAAGTIIATLILGFANEANKIVTAGADAVISFINGIASNINRVVTAGVDIVIALMNSISDNAIRLAEAAFDCLITFLNELAAVIEEKSGELRAAGANIAFAIADGITGGLASKARSVAEKATGIAGDAVGAVENFLGIGSPSKVFIEIGEFMGEGMVIGIGNSQRPVERAAESMANAAVSSLRTIIAQVTDEMSAIGDTSPVITPVLDLTSVQTDATRIASIIQDIQPSVPINSFNQAQLIATSPNPKQPASLDSSSTEPTGGVQFNQTINSPTQLSTADIYKQTRNQITLAKEELDVP